MLLKLVGSQRQVQWADSIRERALQRAWPEEAVSLFRRITDATWWIANREALGRGEFKPPAPAQLDGGGPSPRERPALSAGTGELALLEEMPRGCPEHDVPAWVRSVSQDPRLACAAMCAALLPKYTAPGVRSQLMALAEAQTAAVERDLVAIQRMLQVNGAAGEGRVPPPPGAGDRGFGPGWPSL